MSFSALFSPLINCVSLARRQKRKENSSENIQRSFAWDDSLHLLHTPTKCQRKQTVSASFLSSHFHPRGCCPTRKRRTRKSFRKSASWYPFIHLGSARKRSARPPAGGVELQLFESDAATLLSFGDNLRFGGLGSVDESEKNHD